MPLYPASCPVCQTVLAPTLPEVLPPVRTQIWDIPPIQPSITEYQQHSLALAGLVVYACAGASITEYHASLSETLTTMSASLIADPAFTISLPGKGLDVAAMLADPQIVQSLHAALDAFVQAIRLYRTNDAVC